MRKMQQNYRICGKCNKICVQAIDFFYLARYNGIDNFCKRTQNKQARCVMEFNKEVYSPIMQNYLEKADALKPELKTQTVEAVGDFGEMKNKDVKIFDFGNHFVGYVKIRFSCTSGKIDAPIALAVTFAETKTDLKYVDPLEMQGSISGGWVQQEFIRVEDFPCDYVFERRYACRYVQVLCIGSSSSFKFSIDKVEMLECTSANKEVPTLGRNEEEKKMDEVSIRTLRSCMQDVFEDGPKRDRRLWLGDLRLQALVNYETYQNYDLVKRCLYLFAGLLDDVGRVPGSVFTKPVNRPGSIMFDYPLLFIPTLYEYMVASNDKKTAEELYEIALLQMEIAKSKEDEKGLISEEKVREWCFIDWTYGLDKVSCGQAVYIYALKYLVLLSKALGKDCGAFQAEIERVSKASIDKYFDKNLGLFVGKDGQISYAMNVWFCLANVLDRETNRVILQNLEKVENAIKPVTPYMYHYYVQALIDCGESEKAYHVIMNYWGGMVKMGANTFFEVYNPENPMECPYRNVALLSQCHAWSCTPSYFLRKYYK